MAESIGQEKFEAFLAGALVRLVLFPDGQFTAYSKKGGELVSFSLGRKVVSTGEESTTDEDNWVKRSGRFTVPKRPQNVSLSVMTSGQELNADCFNQFGHSEVPTTFHLGVLDGLFLRGAGRRTADRVSVKLDVRATAQALATRDDTAVVPHRKASTQVRRQGLPLLFRQRLNKARSRTGPTQERPPVIIEVRERRRHLDACGTNVSRPCLLEQSLEGVGSA